MPKLAALMDDAAEDVLAYMGFPPAHRSKVSVVPAPSRTPIDKGRLWDLDDDRGRGSADGAALRSASPPLFAASARSRKSATAAILSPTAMRARGFA
jgi:hypothetical protein